MTLPYRTNARSITSITSIASIAPPRRLYPNTIARVRAFCGAGAFVVCATLAPAASTGCNASSAQIQQSIVDGEQLATCILSTVLSGVTDPLALAQRCGGALPAVIADVIADFETKTITASFVDAGAEPTGATAARRKLSTEEQQLLDEAKRKAAEMLAAEKAANKAAK